MKWNDIRGVASQSFWIVPSDQTQKLKAGFVQVSATSRLGEIVILRDDRLMHVRIRKNRGVDELAFHLASGQAYASYIERVAKDGSAQLVCFFFNGPVQEMGDVSIALNDSVLELARKSLRNNRLGIKELINALEEACVLSTNNDSQGTYFLMTAGHAASEVFNATEEALEVKEKLRGFCIHGYGFRVAVARMRKVGQPDSLYVSKLIRADASGSDNAIRLARGSLKFVDGTQAAEIRALTAGTLSRLIDREDSYLRKWDEYGNKEGEMLLARARNVGKLQFTKVESLARGIELFFDKALPDAIAINDTLEFVETEPLYLRDPEITWEQYEEQLREEFFSTVEDGNRKNSKSENRHVTASVIRSSEFSLQLDVQAQPKEGKHFLVLSLSGDMAQIKRRMQARQSILEGRSANPQLGLIVEENGDVAPSLPRPAIPALSSFVREKVFAHGPTLRQEEAVGIALNTPDIALIQGPPGTGKTTVIAAIIERLNEISDKDRIIRGDILITASQHDAVENIKSRLSVNSIPIPKFGQRRGQVDTSIREVSDWGSAIASQLRVKNPSLTDSESRREIRFLCTRYLLSPSSVTAIALVKAIREQQATWLDADIMSRASSLLEILTEQDKRSRLAGDESALNAVRGLRVFESSFQDDGPQKALDVLVACEAALSHQQRMILQQAASWTSPEPLPPLTDLREIKASLLELYSDSSFFRIDKPRADVLQFVADAESCLMRYRRNHAEESDEILADLLHTLENDPSSVRQAIEAYSLVFSATVQGAAGNEIRDAKSLSDRFGGSESDADSVTYDTVIVDEAARTSPRDLLIPMAQARRRIILVGDHRQLPHLVDEEIVRAIVSPQTEMSESIADKENEFIETSLFQYLFERLKKLERKDGIKRRVTLDKQFRMHPVLGKFVSENFYEKFDEGFGSPLKAELFAHELCDVAGCPAAWLDVAADRGSEAKEGTSWVRRCEADTIAWRLKKWMDSPQAAGLTFGVISFYKSQVECVYEALERQGMTFRNQDNLWEVTPEYLYLRNQNGEHAEERLRIGTVDAFQGMEFDVVFLSMVRTARRTKQPSTNPEIRQNEIRQTFGHLVSPNRLCVSMSRQQRMLVMVGDTGLASHPLAIEAIPAIVNFHKLCVDCKSVLEAAQ